MVDKHAPALPAHCCAVVAKRVKTWALRMMREMIRQKLGVELQYEIDDYVNDFMFNIQATKTKCQSVLIESLEVRQAVDVVLFADSLHGNRYALQCSPCRLQPMAPRTIRRLRADRAERHDHPREWIKRLSIKPATTAIPIDFSGLAAT